MFAEAINAHSRRNWFVMKYMGKMSLTIILTFLVLAGAILGYLIYPGRPSESQVMTFEGFIELPLSGRLTILDYLGRWSHPTCPLFSTAPPTWIEPLIRYAKPLYNVGNS